MTSYIDHATAPETNGLSGLMALSLLPLTAVQLWADSWASLIGSGAEKLPAPEAAQLPVPNPLQKTDDFA